MRAPTTWSVRRGSDRGDAAEKGCPLVTPFLGADSAELVDWRCEATLVDSSRTQAQRSGGGNAPMLDAHGSGRTWGGFLSVDEGDSPNSAL